jgi:hypothetical protein
MVPKQFVEISSERNSKIVLLNVLPICTASPPGTFELRKPAYNVSNEIYADPGENVRPSVVIAGALPVVRFCGYCTGDVALVIGQISRFVSETGK